MGLFPTKILLTTDGSENAELAARTAIGLTVGTDSELHVVHVGLAIPAGLPPYIPEGSEPGLLKREARELLDDQLQKIKTTGGGGAQAHLRMGGAAEEIVALGEEIGAGLIVVGSRGHGLLRRALMGSVSDSVVRYAHCPVLVVRGARELGFSSKRILLATDGSEEAELALQAAVDLANATGSELHVVHVGHLLGYAGGLGPDVGPLPGSQEDFDRKARKLLDAQVERVEAAGGVVAQAHLGSGTPPAAEIVALGEEIGAGLIVLGSRGAGGIRRALMGSVADSVIRHAHCAVLVVRNQDTRRHRREGDKQDLSSSRLDPVQPRASS